MIEVGSIIERSRACGGQIRGLVVSNDRDGLFIMSTTGWHMAIPSTHVRVLTDADESYAATKKRCERHWQRFLKG